jgi:hypothetical protein
LGLGVMMLSNWVRLGQKEKGKKKANVGQSQ